MEGSHDQYVVLQKDAIDTILSPFGSELCQTKVVAIVDQPEVCLYKQNSFAHAVILEMLISASFFFAIDRSILPTLHNIQTLWNR